MPCLVQHLSYQYNLKTFHFIELPMRLPYQAPVTVLHYQISLPRLVKHLSDRVRQALRVGHAHHPRHGPGLAMR